MMLPEAKALIEKVQKLESAVDKTNAFFECLKSLKDILLEYLVKNSIFSPAKYAQFISKYGDIKVDEWINRFTMWKYFDKTCDDIVLAKKHLMEHANKDEISKLSAIVPGDLMYETLAKFTSNRSHFLFDNPSISTEKPLKNLCKDLKDLKDSQIRIHAYCRLDPLALQLLDGKLFDLQSLPNFNKDAFESELSWRISTLKAILDKHRIWVDESFLESSRDVKLNSVKSIQEALTNVTWGLELKLLLDPKDDGTVSYFEQFCIEFVNPGVQTSFQYSKAEFSKDQGCSLLLSIFLSMITLVLAVLLYLVIKKLFPWQNRNSAKVQDESLKGDLNVDEN